MKKYIELKVTGNETELMEFITLCKQIEYLGKVGSSRTIKVHVDGDGSFHLKFDLLNGEAFPYIGSSENMDLHIGE